MTPAFAFHCICWKRRRCSRRSLLLQNNPSFVALVSIDVAQFCSRHRLARSLPLAFASRSEPYELVTRKGAPLSPGARLLIDELTGTDTDEA